MFNFFHYIISAVKDKFVGLFKQEIVATNPYSAGNFGYSVSISNDGEIMIVGAPNEDAPYDTNNGAVYLFEKDSNGEMQQILRYSVDSTEGATYDNDNDLLGYFTAISKDKTLVAASAPGHDYIAYYSRWNCGGIFFFTNNGTSWVYSSILNMWPYDMDGSDYTGDQPNSGYSFALSNQIENYHIVAVAMPAWENYPSSTDYGAVYVHLRYINGVIGNTFRLYGTIGSGYGKYVALTPDATRMVVVKSSTIIVYTRGSGIDYNEEQSISSSGVLTAEISIDGEYIVSANSTSGLNIYKRTDTTWGLIQSIPGTYELAKFSDDMQYLFASNSSYDTPLTNCGLVYVFKNIDGSWTLYKTIQKETPASNDYFGRRFDITEDGNIAAIGSYTNKVYIFE